MNIVLNGSPHVLGAPCSLAELVAQLQLSGQRLAIECNDAVVPRADWTNRQLGEGDRVEIVRAIGGG